MIHRSWVRYFIFWKILWYFGGKTIAPQNLTKMSTAKRFGERTADNYKVTRSRQGANPLCLKTPVHNEIIIFSATVT